jgi:hypothetical protein
MSRRLGQIVFLCIVAMLAVVATPVAMAQTSQISGQVTDQQGAVVPNATVRVINQDSLQRRETKSNETGNYTVSYLPAGRYQVVVEAQGFSTAASKDVRLASGQSVLLNMQLAVAAATTQVTVEAGPNQIELDNPALSGTLTQKEVVSFGLNGRNFTQLIALTPGVSNQTGQDEAKVGIAGSAKFSVNGGRVEYNTFEVDGSDVLNTSINASRGQAQPLVVYPSIDAIQEVQVLTSNYGAMYGKSGSGSVLATTKSGTNAFRGNVYEFLRNEDFNARNYFDQTKHAPLYRRNDFGATLGGPFFIPKAYNQTKDKTFFFLSEEFRIEKTPTDYNQAVPSVQQRQGNFSDVCPNYATSQNFAVISNPDCPTFAGGGAQPTQPVWSAIVQDQLDPSPVSLALLKTNVIPLPNSNTGCNSTMPSSELHCYDVSVSPSTFWREELFRGDQDLTPSETLSFRFIHDTWRTTTLTPQWGLVVNSFPTVQNKLEGPGVDMALSLAQTLPRNILNRIVFAYSASDITLATEGAPGVNLSRSDSGIDASCHQATYNLYSAPGTQQTGTLCPVGELFPDASGKNLIPGLEFNGTNPAYGGHGFDVDTGYAPWEDANPTYMLRDDVSRTFGHHTLQAGAQLYTVQENQTSGVSGANTGDTQGLLTYSNQLSPHSTNNAFADFLGCASLSANCAPLSGDAVGLDNSYIQSYSQDSGKSRYYDRYHSLEFYVQDDWRATPHLTLNLGFRGSLFGTWYNARGTAWNWEPQAFNASLANTVYLQGTTGWLDYQSTGRPVPFDPAQPAPALVNGLVHCGVNGVPQGCMASSVFHPGPRVGFAWDPFGKGTTSLRGGYGIFWEHGTSSEANVGSLIGSAPLIFSETYAFNGLVQNYSCIGGGALTAPSQVNVQCLGYGNVATGSGTYLPAAFPLNVTSIPTKAVYANIQQWSLSIEHEVQKNLVFTAAYAGTKGTHLTAEYNINQISPVPVLDNPFQPGEPITSANCGGGTTGQGQIAYPTAFGLQIANPGQPFYPNLAAACYGSIGFGFGSSETTVPSVFRPYRGFNQIFAIRNVAASQYHALQSTLHKTAGPLDLGVSYTYSHSLDDASDRFNANFVNAYDLSQNKASSDFDERHMLNVSYIYDFSFRRALQAIGGWDSGDTTNELEKNGKGGNWLDSPGARTLLDGWQLSGITFWLTGTPFSVVNGGGSNGVGVQDSAGVAYGLNAGSYPDVVAGVPRNERSVGGRNAQSFGPLLRNPSMFMAPRGLTYGDAGRNYLNNPSRTNFNTALLKHFKVLGERDVEFRAEAFNVFNHTQFRLYDPTHPGNTGNNIISCYGGPSTGYSAAGGDGADCLTGNSFLHPVDAHDPRILQFGLKLAY